MIVRAGELMAAAPPAKQELTDAFWQACHGGQRRMAKYLLALGAALNGTPSWRYAVVRTVCTKPVTTS
jgi:uncharacterized protein